MLDYLWHEVVPPVFFFSLYVPEGQWRFWGLVGAAFILMPTWWIPVLSIPVLTYQTMGREWFIDYCLGLLAITGIFFITWYVVKFIDHVLF